MKTLLATASFTLLLCVSASAALFTWTGAVDNTFTTPGNWDPDGPLLEADQPIFAPAGEAITVNFPGATSTTGLQIRGSTVSETESSVTFDLGNSVYTVTGAAADRLLLMQNAAAGNRNLVLQNGELRIAIGAAIWGNANVNTVHPEVSLRITDGATLRHTSSAGLGRTQTAGQVATTNLIIEDGGTLITEDQFSVGGNGGTGTRNGNLQMSGPAAKWEAKASDRSVILLGYGLGANTVTVNNGALIDSTRAIGVAFTNDSTGLLTVSGSHVDEITSEVTASRILGNQLYIGGGRLRDNSVEANLPRAGGEGVAEFINGGYGQFTTLLNYHNDVAETKGTLRIDDAFVTVSGTATFQAGSAMELGLRSPGQDALLFANTLNLDGTLTLLLDGSFSAALNDSIHLIEYTSLTGTFTGLDEGDTISVGGYTFSIHYNMDDLNTIGLTVIPEPATLSLLAASLALALTVLRKRKK